MYIERTGRNILWRRMRRSEFNTVSPESPEPIRSVPVSDSVKLFRCHHREELRIALLARKERPCRCRVTPIKRVDKGLQLLLCTGSKIRFRVCAVFTAVRWPDVSRRNISFGGQPRNTPRSKKRSAQKDGRE